MNAEFLDLVVRLRAAQKAWFKHRRTSDLEESKRLEREVDRAIERERGPKAAPSLFDRMGGQIDVAVAERARRAERAAEADRAEHQARTAAIRELKRLHGDQVPAAELDRAVPPVPTLRQSRPTGFSRGKYQKGRASG
jgi:hypothetical protein